MRRNIRISRIPTPSNILPNDRFVDDDIAGMVIGHKEDGRTMRCYLIFFDFAAIETQSHGIAIIVNSATTTATGRTTSSGIASITNCMVM